MNYRFLRILTITSLSITLHAQPAVRTVEWALESPSHQAIKKALESRGGSYSDEVADQIQVLVQDILQGEYTLSAPPIQKKSSSLKHIATLLSSSQVTKLSTKLLSKLTPYLPALTYTALMKNFVDACHSVHTSIASQKEAIAAQDKEIGSSVILRTAHHLALDAVLHLLFTLYAQKAHPCERMHALYILNTVYLSGSHGLAFERFRARANRFYFKADGALRDYDPSADNAHTPKRVKALAKFIKAVSPSKCLYLSYLRKGLDHGIYLLENHYQKASRASWHTGTNRFVWRYMAGVLREITSIDVIHIRTVDPRRVFSRKGNKDLLKIMILCSLHDTDEETRHESLKKAGHILTTYKNCHATQGCPLLSIMERYYQASCKRFM